MNYDKCYFVCMFVLNYVYCENYCMVEILCVNIIICNSVGYYQMSGKFYVSFYVHWKSVILLSNMPVYCISYNMTLPGLTPTILVSQTWDKLKNFWNVLEKKFQLWYRYQSWTLVSVLDTQTWFWLFYIPYARHYNPRFVYFLPTFWS